MESKNNLTRPNKIREVLKKNRGILLSAREVGDLVDKKFPGSSSVCEDKNEYYKRIRKALNKLTINGDIISKTKKELEEFGIIINNNKVFGLTNRNGNFKMNIPIKSRVKVIEVKERKMKKAPVSGNIYTGDNLKMMRGLEDSCIDLIYLDPPYNSKQDYKATEGSESEGAEFKDTWGQDDINDDDIEVIKSTSMGSYRIIDFAGNDLSDISMKAYLIFMTVRLLEMHRILKDTGSIYLHVDPTASHYLKLIMDAIFGRKQFRNEIIWGYTGPGSPNMKQFNRKHDNIFWYSKGGNWIFNADDVRIPHKDGGPHSGGFTSDTDTGLDDEKINEYARLGKVPETWWIQEPGNGLCVVARSKKENTGYPTQKPLALLKRIILASSNEDDLVFDPFCGSGTTLVASMELERKWIGCDLTKDAVEQSNSRIKNMISPINFNLDSPDSIWKRK